jgi:hypothetical protein
MRKLIFVIGIFVIAATALAWSNLDRTTAPETASAPINPNEMTIKDGSTLPFEYLGAF